VLYLALSNEQKQQIFSLLACGQSAVKVAQTVGCSRATVQRLKKESKNDPLLKTTKGIAQVNVLQAQGSQVLETLDTLKEREPAIQQGLWDMFEGLSGLFKQVLDNTDPEDVSPRQLPALAKASADLATAYADFADRVYGLEVLAGEVEKINGIGQA